MPDRRVVVTGLGALTPIGLTTEAYWENLCEGRSGVSTIQHIDTTDLGSRIAGSVYDYDALEHFDKKSARKNERFTQFAIVVARAALQDAGIEVDEASALRIGVTMGCGIGGLQTIEDQNAILLEKGARRVSPFLIPKIISNMAAGAVSIELGVKGPNSCVVTACATGTHCIGDAYHVVRRGDADVMICGGTEAAITRLGVAGFSNMHALSTRNDDPQRASRPFDAERDGFVIGEGAGVLILEELERARARGARIYAEMVGYGMSSDGYHITAPDPEGNGGARAMKAALDSAGVNPEDLDYINAHGTSTPLNDKIETMAIKTVLGDRARNVPVSSNKSMIGHLLGAAGGVEAVAMALSIQNGVLPPTVNYENPDPDCDLDYVPNTAREAPVGVAMSNSLGFGGHNCSIVMKRFEG